VLQQYSICALAEIDIFLCAFNLYQQAFLAPQSRIVTKLTLSLA
jgi:hypothetical protein